VTWPNQFYPDHFEAARPCARGTVVPNECRGWWCASSVSRSDQETVSQRVPGGGSLYQSPGWWVAVRGGRGMPTSGRALSCFFDRCALSAFLSLAAERARRGPETAWWGEVARRERFPMAPSRAHRTAHGERRAGTSFMSCVSAVNKPKET